MFIVPLSSYLFFLSLCSLFYVLFFLYFLFLVIVNFVYTCYTYLAIHVRAPIYVFHAPHLIFKIYSSLGKSLNLEWGLLWSKAEESLSVCGHLSYLWLKSMDVVSKTVSAL